MPKPISVNTVKIQNRLSVFRELAYAGESTRTELARKCGLSLGTVVTILEELAAHGIVVETLDQRTTVGRKPHLVRLVGNAKRVISIDLASRNFLYEIFHVDLNEGVGAKYQFLAEKSFEANLRRMLLEIRRCMKELEIDDDEIIGVGVSVPGSYRYSSDSIENAPFPELQQMALKTLMQEYFGQTISIDHDVFLATRAEIRYIPDYRNKNVFYMFLGEGVGGALAAGGELYRGAREDAGDIGRMYITDNETLEELVSWNRTAPLLEYDGSTQAVESWRVVASGEEPGGSQAGTPIPAAVEEVARVVARALQNAFWILDPNCFVIGGEYQRFGSAFINLIVQELKSFLEPSVMETLEVRISRHGARGALLGAAQMARQEWLVSL